VKAPNVRPIKEYCMGIYDGPHATPRESEEGPIFLGIKNITTDGRLDFSEIRHVSEQEFPRWTRRVLPEPGDVVFTYEATLHRYAVIPEAFRGCLGRRIALIRPNPDLADSRYLLYFFLSDQWRSTVESSVITGATVDRIPLEKFPNLPAALPDVPIQRRTADILSAYDDLIENNRRRMALLEESARLLYREWFVRLRFPGYEHTRIVDGVPEGWDIQTVDDVCNVGRGASPRPIAAFLGGDIPWFKIGDGTASESMFIFDTEEKVTDDGAQKSFLLEPRSLILSNSATCGIPFMTGVRGCVHDGWLHFAEYRRVSVWFLYFYFRLKREELISSVSDGSTQKNLNTAAVGRMRIALPRSDSLLHEFDAFAEPVFSSIFVLSKHNIALRTARDLLLPKLMSGELVV